jgi:hypothetical protein
VQGKREAIQEAIETLERIEKVLLEKGAKTYKDLFPEEAKKEKDHPNYNAYNHINNENTDVKNRYAYDFSFSNVIDVTPARKAAYLDL